jgi:hypothetical protein
MEIEGTIRTLDKLERRKKDGDKELGKIVIMNEEGDRVDVKSTWAILDGYNPEDNVKVTISRNQKTVQESVEESQ